MILNKCLEVNQSKKQESSLVGKKPVRLKLNTILIIILGLIALSITVYTSYAIFSSDISGINTISVSFKKSERHPLLTSLILGDNNSNVTMGDDLLLSNDGLFSTTSTNFGKPSYYYSGNVNNNYVKLDEDKDGVADTLYRIIRINEDGSVRLIRQDGIDNNASYKFNSVTNDYKYMYYSESNVEGSIMKKLDDWYTNAFGSTKLDTKIVESEFCEQAKVTNLRGNEPGNTNMEDSDYYVSTYKCVTDGNGKGILNKKVGLISLDEAVYAGIPLYTSSQTNNTNTYLQTGQHFWTISPGGFIVNTVDEENAFAWFVSSLGYIDEEYVDSSYIIRPVINLAADTQAMGTGLSSDPWIIS